MAKVKEVTVGIGTPSLPPEAVAKFEEAASHHRGTQRAFLEAFQLSMTAMKKWYKNDEERAFEVVKELARPICYKHMSKKVFSSLCRVSRKLRHYKLTDWDVAKSNADVLDEARSVCAEMANDDDTYGTERLTYSQAMQKEVRRVEERKRKEESLRKIPGGLNCVAPDPRQYESVEEFTKAIWDFFNFYLTHDDLEDALDEDPDLGKIRKVVAKHATDDAT